MALQNNLSANSHAVGILLANDQGDILYSQNEKTRLIPASTLKILTSLLALSLYGPNYSFKTEFFYDTTNKDLIIKGYADPLFISEEIEKFVTNVILTYEIKQVRNIILDHSYFSENILIPGEGNSLNPYDASVGALCANFNTVMFKTDKTNNYISGERQTPLLPILHDSIKRTRLKEGRIVLSKLQSRLYAGWIVKYFLEKNHIPVTGSVLQGQLKHMKGDSQYYYSSFTMTDVVKKLLKYSNNFIANQLLLSMGAQIYGAPATLGKGIKALDNFVRQELDLSNVKLVEGSGLSRANRITPKQMLEILMRFMPYSVLLNQNEGEYFKTGTLDGIKTRAGYIVGKNNKLYPYVIMINQKGRHYDKLLKDLKSMVQ